MLQRLLNFTLETHFKYLLVKWDLRSSLLVVIRKQAAEAALMSREGVLSDELALLEL